MADELAPAATVTLAALAQWASPARSMTSIRAIVQVLFNMVVPL
jgi:hypothetical protein